MTAIRYEQLDLFAEVPESPFCLFGSTARGLAARTGELEAWIAKYGRTGCLVRSHAWNLDLCTPKEPTKLCRPSALWVDMRVPTWERNPEPRDCDCTDVHDTLLHRGACTGCDWEGPVRGLESLAVQDAHDHAWPGWRDLPLVPGAPSTGAATSKAARQQADRWIEEVEAGYPAGWLKDGGPIRTARDLLGSRDFWPGTPFGGYDLAYVTEPGAGTCRHCRELVSLDVPGQLYRLAADGTGTCPADRDGRHRPTIWPGE